MSKGTPALVLPSAAEKRAAKYFTPTVVEQLGMIEAELGGRRELVGMLVLAPLTPDLQYVLGLLGDPKCDSSSLAAICAMGNVLPGKLLEHLASAALLRGKVRASQKIGEGIVAVTEDVMRRAAPYEAPCNGGCAGLGMMTPDPTPDTPNPSPETCEVCHGTGKLLYSPDLDRQRLAVDLAQLLPKSSGLQIAVQQNNQSSASAGQGAIEKLISLTDRLLYGEALIEAERVEVEEPPPAGPVEDA